MAALASQPRAAGSEAEAAAREFCADWLRSLGFEVHGERFDYSAFPGRWATPLAGITAVLLLLAAGHVGHRGSGGLALLILSAGLTVSSVACIWLARSGVRSFPWQRRQGVNLIARRGAPDEMPCWMMAHLDSKSQPVPIAVRAAGLTATALILTVALLYAAAQWAGAVDGTAWLLLVASGVVCALPVLGTMVGNRSPGALDDASGVAAVLLAAAMLPAGRPCGICLTSAEELGLAGVRAWMARRVTEVPRPVINVDGVDDEGRTQLMWSGRRPSELLAMLEGCCARTGHLLSSRRLIPGILTDSVAVADEGWPAVTVSRGNLRTLLRIHSPADRPEMLRGDGIREVAGIISEAVDTIARAQP